MANHARPGAVAAIGRAVVQGEEEDAIGIAVDQAGHRTVAVFSQGIVRLAPRLNEFAG